MAKSVSKKKSPRVKKGSIKSSRSKSSPVVRGSKSKKSSTSRKAATSSKAASRVLKIGVTNLDNKRGSVRARKANESAKLKSPIPPKIAKSPVAKSRKPSKIADLSSKAENRQNNLKGQKDRLVSSARNLSKSAVLLRSTEVSKSTLSSNSSMVRQLDIKPGNVKSKPMTKVGGLAKGTGFVAKNGVHLSVVEKLKVVAKFRVGDKVVYPTHGIGQVNAIIRKSLGGTDMECYDILIIESGMRMWVPVDQVESKKLRPVVDKKTLDRVYDILKERSGKIDTQTWNRRYREYTQKIQTGSLYEMAEVFRDLSVLSAGKELSFGERRMLEKVEDLLVAEIAVAKSKPTDRIKGELADLVSA